MPTFVFPIQPGEIRTRIYDLSNTAPMREGEELETVVSSSCTKNGVAASGILDSITIDTANPQRFKVKLNAAAEGDVHRVTALFETTGENRIEVDIDAQTATEYLDKFEMQPSEITVRAIDLANQSELKYDGETLTSTPAVTIIASDSSSTSAILKSATHSGSQARIRVGTPTNGITYTVTSLSTTSGGHKIAGTFVMVGAEA